MSLPTLTHDEHTGMLELMDRIQVARHKESRDRTHPNWIDRERLAMCVEANLWALAHRRPTITVDDIERIEGLAVGHSDYASKISFYVAQLVYGVRT